LFNAPSPLAGNAARDRCARVTTSRLAATCREFCLWIPLGPLPLGESVLYLRQCPALATLIHGGPNDLALAQRCLDVSRGHPLILERLCAVDLLLGRLGPDGRRLLWLLALAGEPVEESMLAGVWVGEWLDGLLQTLHHAGLVDRESDPGPWTCHELVRERALAWMDAHPDERAGLTAEQVWVDYAERFESLFKQLLGSGAENARDHAVVAGRRALGYCVRAGALARLSGFAGEPETVDSTLCNGCTILTPCQRSTA
jgi:hypothetical protein